MSQVIVDVSKPRRPLFVAVHSVCDKACWYCTEYGENRSVTGRLSAARLLQILEVAYAQGIRTFRITGGEPTLRRDLVDLLPEIQRLGADVRIAMTTNGARLDRLIDTVAELREPRIFVSVDGLAPGKHVEKWLTPSLARTIERVAQVSRARLNFVLTSESRPQLFDVIDFAVARGIDVKIFELLLRDYFFSGSRRSDEVFADRYVPIREFLPELRRRFGESVPFGGTGGRGIPMYAFQAGTSRIVYFDSQQGSHYGPACITCSHFPCQEGLYALLLDVNGMLHPAGCENRLLYEPLAVLDRQALGRAFRRMQGVIEDASLQPVLPQVLAGTAPAWS